MDDQLFEPTTPEEPPKPPNGEPQKPGAGTGDSPAGDPSGDIATLKADMAATNRAVGELTSTLKGLLQASQSQPAPDEPETPPDTAEALNKLASDPAGFVEELAKGIYSKEVESQVVPVARSLLETQHDNFLVEHKTDVDSEFGDGTWDAIFVPAIAPKVDQVKANNMVLLGRRDTLDMLVAEVKGRNMTELTKRAGEAAKAAEDARMRERAEIVSSLPPAGMRRRPAPDGELTEDAKLMLAEIEKATGGSEDRKLFAKMHGTGGTLSDFLEATQGGKK